MNSAYHGYTQANQSVLEERDEEDSDGPTEEVDLEAGRSTIFHSTHEARSSPKAQGKRRVAWDSGAAEMSTLHPNIHKEDKIHEQESSDDEVPQSFKVEAAPRPSLSPKFVEQTRKQEARRGHALYSTSGRSLPPSLPTVADKSPSPVSAPPRPSEVDDEESRSQFIPRVSSPSQGSSSTSRQPRGTMRGLDDYEKALWNWVNVYNLDAFLQEVYSYYEGKGIYSIALSRGLNLLYVYFLIFLGTH